MEKEYLGDAVYAEIESGMLKLTTNHGGLSNDDTIYLEMPVFKQLVDYVQRATYEPKPEQE